MILNYAYNIGRGYVEIQLLKNQILIYKYLNIYNILFYLLNNIVIYQSIAYI